MHLHLPKPLHGWRALVGEVGVIVLGILIALAAQQLVETLHWRNKAHQATELLREELGEHYHNASEAVISAPCIDRQILVLESRLSNPNTHFEPVPAYAGPFGDFTIRVPNRVWSDDVWRSVVSDGVPSYLPADLRTRLGQHYSQVDFMRDDTRATDLLAWRMRGLARAIHPDAATRARMIEELEETRGRVAEMALVGNEIVALVEDMNLAPPKSEVSQVLAASGTLKFCSAHGLELGKVEPRR